MRADSFSCGITSTVTSAQNNGGLKSGFHSPLLGRPARFARFLSDRAASVAAPFRKKKHALLDTQRSMGIFFGTAPPVLEVVSAAHEHVLAHVQAIFGVFALFRGAMERGADHATLLQHRFPKQQ